MLPLLPALFLGCKAVDPAPPDLETLLHQLWQESATGSDRALADAVADLDAVVPAPPADGSLSPMDAEGIAAADLDRSPEPGRAVGMWIASDLPCTLDQVAEIYTHPDQHVLYDIFDSYERQFDGSRAAFLDGTVDDLAWTVTYGASIPLASPYTADLAAGVRRIDDVLIARSVLVEPATFEKGEHVFDQDYRVEVFTVPEPGVVRHVEGLWRHMEAGVVVTDNEGIQRAILNGLADWDAQTATLCTDGLP